MTDIICIMIGCFYLGYLMRWLKDSKILEL